MEKALEIVRGKMGSDGTEKDLSTSEEKLVMKYVKETYGHEFAFITEFPIQVRPFYHMRKNESVTLSTDLLFKEREILTSAQREHRYKILTEQAKDKKLDTNKLEHYLDFFKHSCPPHGGFGFGFERFLKILLDLPNIREAVFLPRDMKRITP